VNRIVPFLVLAAALVISTAMFVLGNRYAFVAPDGRYYALKLDRWTGKTWTVMPYAEYVNLEKGLHPSVVERPEEPAPRPVVWPTLRPGEKSNATLDMLLGITTPTPTPKP
jgi:hypothetical protein